MTLGSLTGGNIDVDDPQPLPGETVIFTVQPIRQVGHKKKCVNCGKEFIVSGDKKRNKTCSKECFAAIQKYNNYKNGKWTKDLVEFDCPTCGKKFTRSKKLIGIANHSYRSRGKDPSKKKWYCSRACKPSLATIWKSPKSLL